MALTSLVGLNTAQADLVFQSFDTSSALPDGNGGDMSASSTYVWSPTNFPNPDVSVAGSGSLYVTVPNTAAGSGWEEYQLNFTMGQNMSPYINVNFDFMVDVANSATNSGGNYGGIEAIIQNWDGAGSPGWCGLNTMAMANTSGWQHYSASLAAFSGYMDRFILDINSSAGQFGNTANPAVGVSVWVDNIIFTQPALPPPTLATPIPAPKNAGLTLLPATTGEYQRVMIYPNANLGTSWGWYGQATAGDPVSYSITITNFPDVGNYNAQIFWIPVDALEYSANDTSVDWNCTNDMVFSIGASNNQGLSTNWTVTLATKTNSPGGLGNGNPNLTITNFNWKTLPLGTWTITFVDNTDFTITAPDKSVVTGSLPPDVANLVSGNAVGNTAMLTYFGVQPNNPQGIGKPTVINNITVSGTPTTINDSFNFGYLDTTNTWTILSDYPADITVNSGNLAWYETWNTPNDNGYSSLLAASSPKGIWQDLVPANTWLLVNGNRMATITTNALQSALGAQSPAFLRLIKRVATQLQVLMPGETNAPNTVLGKTGTPTAFNPYDEVDVTINMVDATYHIVNSADSLSLTTTDTSATINTPTPTLTSGTVTVPIYFGTAGSWTVTAADTTSTNITSGISSAVTIQ